MSEKDGKRVLSPAEKAEADAPTNKQWLYTIGGPTGSRRWLSDSDDRRHCFIADIGLMADNRDHEGWNQSMRGFRHRVR